MNKFSDFFNNQPKSHAIHKWLHYFDIYEKHFNKFKGKHPKILEIGVQNGGSIDMWNYYFDGACDIVGVDVDDKCEKLKFSNDNVNIVIGDQGNVNFWKNFLVKHKNFDIIIDDGGHTMQQQKTTFDSMFDTLNDGGIYLCEDTHTSYWENYGGGLHNPNSFVEYSKSLVDVLNMYHIKEYIQEKNSNSKIKNLKEQLWSIAFYDSIVVFEKKNDKIPPSHQIKY